MELQQVQELENPADPEAEEARRMKAMEGVLFNKLLLEQIFGNMSKEQDLYSSRLVCKTWSESGIEVLKKTGWCGQGVKHILNSYRLRDFIEDWTDADTFPFDTFHVCLSPTLSKYPYEHLTCPSLATIYDFFNRFGYFIKNLQIQSLPDPDQEGANEKIIPLSTFNLKGPQCLDQLKYMLRNVPNLEALTLENMMMNITDGSSIFTDAERRAARVLRKMKKLTINELHVYDLAIVPGMITWKYSYGFTEDFLRLMPGLTEFNFRAYSSAGFEGFLIPMRRLTRLTSLGIQFLNASLFYDDFVVRGRTFSELKMSIIRTSPKEAESFHNFLATQTLTLKKLELHAHFCEYPGKELIKVPTLENLKDLSTALVNGTWSESHTNRILMFQPFEPNQFPNLKSVTGHIWFYREAFAECVKSPLRTVDTLCVDFKAEYYSKHFVFGLKDSEFIAYVFPNVKKLKMYQITEKTLRGVFKNLPLLEELDFDYAGEANINVVLCGIPKFPLEHLQWLGDRCIDWSAGGHPGLQHVVAFYCENEIKPSLRRLQQLKRLTIWESTDTVVGISSKKSKELMDISVFLALLKIKPLEDLQLPESWLVLRSKDLLRRFHARLTFSS